MTDDLISRQAAIDALKRKNIPADVCGRTELRRTCSVEC